MYRPGATSQLSATKLVTDTDAVDGAAGHKLNRTLSAATLIMLGVGGTIGTGIFVLTGVAAAQFAGPALVLSFIIAGAGCALAGLCYAEFAAMIPVSGSAYSYTYATLMPPTGIRSFLPMAAVSASMAGVACSPPRE